MICPKCGDTENIKFFLRHQKSNEDDEDTTANCITILHASPDCGFNESYMLEDCLDTIFPDWSEIRSLQQKVDDIEQNINNIDSVSNMFTNFMPGMIKSENEAIEEEENLE